MSFEKIVEDQIRKAIADGKFENLRGQGTALELKSYFQAPEPLRMAYAMLKSGELVPRPKAREPSGTRGSAQAVEFESAAGAVAATEEVTGECNR